MLEGYTQSARRALFVACGEAAQATAEAIGTNHLLLGLTWDDESVVAEVLEGVNLSPEDIRNDVDSGLCDGEGPGKLVEIRFTSELKRVLQYAAAEAEFLRHRFVGAEHLLLGLLREEASAAGTILRARGVRVETARHQLRLLSARPFVISKDAWR